MSFSFGDITGAITGQIGGVLQQTGAAPYLTSIGETTFDIFQNSANVFNTITSSVATFSQNLSKALSGQTIDLILLLAAGGLIIYAYNSATK